MDAAHKELLSLFFKSDKWHFNRCLAPGMNCTCTAIRAHSLQNSRVLDLLAYDGHVKSLGKRIRKERGPVVHFKDVGRNEATTFAGFCSDHDRDIFKPIDLETFRPANSEHLFLIAYRAVARELHVLMEGASKIQSTYNTRVKLGLDSGDEPDPAGMLALEHMIRAYQTYMYKCRFHNVLNSKQYGSVLHDV